MAYDWERKVEIMHELAMKRKAKREQKEKENPTKDIVFSQDQTPEMHSQWISETDLNKTPKIDSQEYIDNCDIPGAMDDDAALLLYIVVMVVGVIFKDRWLIWIGATIAYLCHVFRRQLHKAKWDREHKNK